MNLRITAQAIHDVEDIRNYVAGDDASAAQHTVEQIAKAIGYLRRWPRIGHVGIVRGTLEWSPLRMPYVIVYRIEGADAQVLRIYRHSQDRRD